MLARGKIAPKFELENDQGTLTSLDELLAGGPLILYFYPADFTPGCTREACTIRDIHNDIRSAGLQIVGISPQDAESHTRFRDTHNLPFVLLCDPDKAVARAYDVEGPFGVSVRRATFLIDEQGTVQDAVLADVMIGKHADFIRRAIELRQGA